MAKYNHKKIEKRWQKAWKKDKKLFAADDHSRKPKFYALDMFPYPSGEGLHVGHPRGYIATDVISRYMTMKGYNVLHPMGWDAFGLPAENYAIRHKVHPKISVARNIKRFKKQLGMIGLAYDWSREINTTDPNYYKWTQWIFLQLFRAGLAYQSFEPINWCPSCQTGLANEDLEDGKCERCGSVVEKRPMRQWMLKMTAYAEKLLADLKLLDWDPSIIEQQRNWIGKSEGALIKFEIRNPKSETNSKSQIQNSKQFVEVFTTRADTLFGATYLVLAPEHTLIQDAKFKIQNFEEVSKYIKEVSKKTEIERTAEGKEKSGVELKGVRAINPANNEEIPIFVADYVLGSYGTGAIMAVPAHDARDFEFAKKYNLPIREVIIPADDQQIQNSKIKIQNDADFIEHLPIISRTLDEIGARQSRDNSKFKIDKAFEEDGILINSGKFSGLKSDEARKEIIKWFEENQIGSKKISYKMRDWVFSRQRYWGEPIPLVFCENCAAKIKNQKSKIKIKEFAEGERLNPGWIAVPEKDLPVKLPEVKHYEPTGTGESPLANIVKWVKTKCPKCGGPAKRETNTMPQWAGSSWYYLAYIGKENSKFEIRNSKFKQAERKWLPVDLYVGGVEHATRHLLYARFWHKALYDLGHVSAREPFKKLMNQGLILAEDGRKMSKRWGNVINPDDVVRDFGADSLRLYEMFMGPFGQSIAWSTDGLRGMRRFLERVYKLKSKIKNQKSKLQIKNQNLEILLNKTIKKVTEDIQTFKFNTAISSLMILLNELEKSHQQFNNSTIQQFLLLLAPFAPHIVEELWRELGGKKSIFREPWPAYDKRLIREEEFDLVVQVGGKMRDIVRAPLGISESEALAKVLEREKVKRFVQKEKVRKIIFVPDRLINIII